MKINCNCGEPLVTDSLYPTKQWECYYNFYDDGGEDGFPDHDKRYQVKLGSCIIKRKERYGWFSEINQKIIQINPNNVIEGIIPKFKTGGGCCDWHGLSIKCPSCNKEVATANLDCWQDKNVTFYENKVTRKY